MFRNFAFITLSALVAFSAAKSEAAEETGDWAVLAKGKLEDEFIQHGGKASYRIEKGEIIGTSKPNTPNSFLCTKKEYGDFRLELEFKVHPDLNSGVQIRSHVVKAGAETTSAGKKITGPPGGRVFGYQVEIDPSKRSYSGGVYDEGRRGWLQDLSKVEPAQKAFKPGEWNQMAVECKGVSIKTWINGIPAADLSDDIDAAGFIAFQVHGVGSKVTPMEVRWRNIRVRGGSTSR